MSKVDFVDDIDPKSFVKNTKKAVVLNLDYYEELEHLARIGKATEKAFENGFSINQMHSVLSNVDYCMYDKESLLNWAESDGE